MRRTIAGVLALVMCFTMGSMVSFAESGPQPEPEDSTEQNLVVFGNSMTSGYGLEDFFDVDNGFNVNNNDLDGVWKFTDRESWMTNPQTRGKGRISNLSLPWKLKQYLASKEEVSQCELSSFALNGMTTDEMRGLLDEDFAVAKYQLENELTRGQFGNDERDDIGYTTDHLRSYVSSLNSGGATITDENKEVKKILYSGESRLPGGPAFHRASLYTRSEVAKADVIVIDVCLNNFGSYLGERFAGFYSFSGYNTKQNYHNLKIEHVEGVSQETLSVVRTLKSQLQDSIPLLNNEFVNEAIEALLYSYADCVTNFEASVDIIKELNPDAKIIVVGMYNTVDGIEIVIDGKTVDFGKFAGTVYQALDAYFKAFSKNSANYSFADLSGGLENVVAYMAKAETYEELDQYLLGQMCDMLIELFIDGYSNLDQMAAAVASEKYHTTDATAVAQVRSDLEKKIKTLLVESARATRIDINEALDTILSVSQGGEEVSPFIEDLTAYLDDTTGEYQVKDFTKAMVQLTTRFLIDNALGAHPSPYGCEQKYQAVKAAYDKGMSAQEETIAEIEDMLKELAAKVRGVATQENIDAAIQLIQQIKAGIDYLEQSGYDLQKLASLTSELQSRVSETMDMLGITVEDLVAGGQFIADNIDPAAVAKQIQMMKEIVAEMPEMKTRLNQIIEYLEGQATIISEEDLAKIQRIREALKTATEKGEYQALINELLPIGEQLLEMGKVVSGLPAYEAAIDEYQEASEEATAGLGKRVTALEEQAGQVKARTIDVAVKSEVTFPNGKAKLTLSWEMDPIAEGYEMKINGEKVNYSEEGDMLVYEDTNAQIGKAYSYEITPYMDYTVSKDTDQGVVTESRTAYGKTFKGTVTPKVSVATATIKKVKKAKKAFTVKWNAVAGADGYQVYYKTGKKAKTKSVAGKTSLKVKKLQSGKKYTVKVRAYKTVNGKTYYGAWSAAKKVKVR